MTTAPGRHNWRALVLAHAHESETRLSPSMVAELGAHLEDLYLAALKEGATEAEAFEGAQEALRRSPLAPLADELQRQDRSPAARTTDELARAHERGSLAMLYALRIAFRQFRSRPLFVLLTVLVLGLGTGAAVSVYTVVDAVVLRPLPYRAPDRLVTLWDTNAAKGLAHDPISPVTFMDYRALHIFEDAAAWWRPDVNLVDPGLDPVRVKTIEASANFFAVLGVGPQLGPGFPSTGPFFSTNNGAVISGRLWRTRYGADPSIIGRSLLLNGLSYTVLGVMPDGFDYPGDIDVWQRLTWDLTQHDRQAHFMEAVARLAPGVTLEQAQRDADALAARLGVQFAPSNGGWSFRLIPILDDQLGYYRPALMVMFGAVGLLLVIGCLNVASLLLARALTRDREMVVRTALGATRRQIVTQLLAEGFVLSVAGITVGLALSALAVPALVALTPVNIPRLSQTAISSHVFLFAAAVTVFTTLGFGLIPALALFRQQLGTDLRSGDRGSSHGSRRLYQALVAGEVALACALLVASALLTRTVRHMTHVPLGVDGRKVVVTGVQLSGKLYTSWQAVSDTHAAILEAVRHVPGVLAAGDSNFLPLETGWRIQFSMNGEAPASLLQAPQVQLQSVSEGYFEAMGAQLVAGRFFAPSDRSQAEGVAIVNESFARQYAASRPAIDQHVTIYAAMIGPLGRNLMATPLPDNHYQFPALKIVGVVGDVRNTALGQPVESAIYVPMTQFPFRSVQVAIAATDPATAVRALRQALHDVAPTTPPGPTEAWTERVGQRMAQSEVLMATLSAFGVLAAVLAALGVYGLFSWSVASRRRELAIRLTLGARPSAIGGLVIWQGAILVAIGLGCGWLVVYAVHGVLSTVLFQVSPDDPASTIAAAALLLFASLAACLPAALRAMRVDPVEGLRSE